MPSYHITGYQTGVDFIGWARGILATVQSETGGAIFILLITSYILFLCLGARRWLAVLGAIATAFSSYNMIIIVAGHITKAWTLAFVPLVLTGMVLLFQSNTAVAAGSSRHSRRWAGFITFAFGLALMIASNHLQITYYTALFCAILYIGFLVETLKPCIARAGNSENASAGNSNRAITTIGVTTAILAAGVLLAVLANASNLYMNYESGKESMRGKSELTPLEQSDTPAPAVDGLDKEYVFTWSYGKAETLSLLIPNVMGGESGGKLGKSSHIYQTLKSQGMQVGKEVQTPTYWGDKPFTSGPVYLGAIICFLAVLALFIVPGNRKWWLLGATIFFIILAWGRNLGWFNDWMYYHFPLYAKFRTVEMALVIPAFTVPILAILALKTLIDGGRGNSCGCPPPCPPNADKQHGRHAEQLGQPQGSLLRALYWSAGFVGGICLILAIMPGAFFNFESAFDAQYGLPDWYYTALLQDRQALLQADAWRSFIYIVLAAALLFVFIRTQNRQKVLPYLAVGLVLLVLCDIWQVDKRYLNDGNFLTQQKHSQQSFPKTAVDEWILQDPTPSYRVLNLNGTWQESRTSYFHKSIGGYHAAKLGRYQDLIDRRLMQEENAIITGLQTATQPGDMDTIFANCPTLNMLNAKYIIYSTEQPPLVNTSANGNAWFVQSYRVVNTPDEEMAALQTLDPKTEAVLSEQLPVTSYQLPVTNYQLPMSNYQLPITNEQLPITDYRVVVDSAASIVMTAYFPDRVEYVSTSAQTGLAIFSEVYYKNGWKAFIDGERVPISRADWILRALVIPAGEHKIEMVFDPDDMRLAGTITTIFSGLLMLLVIFSVLKVFCVNICLSKK
jgi:hypothetical protein